MRRPVLALATAVALAGPTVLAFFSGGYFNAARLWACVGAWALMIVAVLVGRPPLPRARAAIAALVGLVAVGAWTLASFAWAPLAGVVQTDASRIALYIGALLVAAALLRGPDIARRVEPSLALGIVVVIAYGLGERLLPGILHYAHSLSAGGRLEQPLTYWNAEGALAAIGLVLMARLAGDAARRDRVRALAAAASPVLGAGVYLSFSRGAIVAAAGGLIVLAAAAPTRPQLRGSALTVVGALLGAAATGPFPGVASLSGPLAARERQGAIALALLFAVVVSIAAATVLAARRERSGTMSVDELPGVARRWPLAGALMVLVSVGLVVGALAEHGHRLPQGATAARLTAVGSDRADYWRVAVRAFVEHPLDGLGSGGFRVAWLRQRTIPQAALDAHSLELQTAAELGLPGLAALALFLAGMTASARTAYRRHPAMVAGWCASLVVWALHSAIDWDWQVPAVTLIALLLGGAVLAAAETPVRRGQSGSARASPPP